MLSLLSGRRSTQTYMMSPSSGRQPPTVAVARELPTGRDPLPPSGLKKDTTHVQTKMLAPSSGRPFPGLGIRPRDPPSTGGGYDDMVSEGPHPSTTCDGCQRPIGYGVRYKCTVCYNIDFCQSCLDRNGHGHRHPMLMLHDSTLPEATALVQQMNRACRVAAPSSADAPTSLFGRIGGFLHPPPGVDPRIVPV